MKTLDLIVPCFNEQETLPCFYDEMRKVIAQIPEYGVRLIFVDDGSRDKTLQLLRELARRDENVKYISFSRNFGKESAMLAGLKAARADFVGLIDADLQHVPELIPKMLEAVSKGNCDIAAARRVDRKGEARLKSVFSNGFYKLINRVSDRNVKIEIGAQDYRIMKKKVAEAIVSMPEYNRFSKGIFSWVGFRTKWFPHENAERVAGKTKWSFRKLAVYAIDGILGFSTAPLRLSLYIGSVTAGLGILYALYIFVRTLLHGPDVPGYPSIICAVMVIGGLILLSLGILGEYVSRIYLEVKHRPDYIIDETNLSP